MESHKILLLFIWIIIGYISGSIPIGYIMGKLNGIDLTKEGSGSTGATNVLRKVGKIAAILTLLLDALKGFIPVYLAIRLQPCTFLVICVAISCIVGHSKSIFLKFKGGKSSATGLGILIALSWEVALITFFIWLVVVITSRYSSLGSIVAVPLAPLGLYLFHKPDSYVIFGVIASIYIVLIRHRENIKRLMKGTEPKIGQNTT